MCNDLIISEVIIFLTKILFFFFFFVFFDQIDGDTDVPSVKEDFSQALFQLMRRARRKEEDNPRGPESPKSQENDDDIDPNLPVPSDINGTQETEQQRRSHNIANGFARHMVNNGVSDQVSKTIDKVENLNGVVVQGQITVFSIETKLLIRLL